MVLQGQKKDGDRLRDHVILNHGLTAEFMVALEARLLAAGPFRASRLWLGAEALVLESWVEVREFQQRVASLLRAHEYRQVADVARRAQIEHILWFGGRAQP